MARIAAVMESQPVDRRRSQDAAYEPGRDISLNGDVFLQQVFEALDATPSEEVLKRITSLPPNRQGKVLDIRRRIADGTYEVADRLDTVIDRVLKAITA